MNTFFNQPVGRSVLYLNDFHFGKHLSELNAISAIIPEEVKSMADLVSATPDVTPDMVEYAIDSLRRIANMTEQVH